MKDVAPSGHSIITGRTATCKAPAFALLRAGGSRSFPQIARTGSLGKLRARALHSTARSPVGIVNAQEAETMATMTMKRACQVGAHNAHVASKDVGAMNDEMRRRRFSQRCCWPITAKSLPPRIIANARFGATAWCCLPCVARRRVNMQSDKQVSAHVLRSAGQEKRCACAQLPSLWRTIHNGPNFFARLWHKGTHGSNI